MQNQQLNQSLIDSPNATTPLFNFLFKQEAINGPIVATYTEEPAQYEEIFALSRLVPELPNPVMYCIWRKPRVVTTILKPGGKGDRSYVPTKILLVAVCLENVALLGGTMHQRAYVLDTREPGKTWMTAIKAFTPVVRHLAEDATNALLYHYWPQFPR